ncbi:class I SAM-dependent methyltransferase [Paractinoplanes brasiliensis]|uniref:Methyltransferase family protein n=1 Tax=Paractinoplanes brasiliensis TaxID=52695 RepID=A0A4R6JYK1_9ACTN|nr:class I SAM-dependent methyltransferase [Actinoplanes brasiliensis]TDO41924.1 methyltransferase family protein [Actinoplanes brasiliensis]
MTSTSQEQFAPVSPAPALTRSWRQSWDEVMAGCLPGLGGFEEALIAATETVRGGAPTRVLDLGGGPGVMAERLAARWPGADVRLLDLDPVLLLLAETAAPAGVTVHRADLASPHWPAAVVGAGPVDLVTIVMTMHYLPEERAGELYRQVRAILRPGGLMVVADLMPDGDLPSLAGSSRPVADEAAAGLAWTRWWEEIEREPALVPWLRQREALFADRAPAEFTPAETWHRHAARAAGFREAGVVWRSGAHAALCAIA